MAPLSTSDLARAREQAAAELEAAIAALQPVLARYGRLTQALGARVGQDLTRRLEVPLILHLARAGLAGWLDRKLTGTPASLRALVVEQHERAGLGEPPDAGPHAYTDKEP